MNDRDTTYKLLIDVAHEHKLACEEEAHTLEAWLVAFRYGTDGDKTTAFDNYCAAVARCRNLSEAKHALVEQLL